MASMPDEPPWGLYDPRQPKDIGTKDVWDLKNLAVESDPDTGWESPGGVVQQIFGSVRPMYASSPVYVIPGTSSKGRRPTNYRRVIFHSVTNQNVRLRAFKTWGNIYDTPLNSDALFLIIGNTHGANRDLWLGHSTPDWSEPEFQNIVDRATTECLVKLGDMKADVGTALAELTKTVTHLAHTAKDLWGTISALKGKRWGELLNILSKRSSLHRGKIPIGATAAQYWLEYNYAWKPLFMEAAGLMDLAKLQLEPAMLVHANRTVHRREWLNIRDQRVNDHWRSAKHTLRGMCKQEACVRLTGRIDNTAMRYATASGLSNPAAIAWELMPYSFVIDWSLPIGNFLQAAKATDGLDFVWGSVSQRIQSHTFVELEARDEGLTLSPGNGELMKYALNRRVLSDFPRPQLYAKSPFSSSHITSALALLRSLT